MKPGTILVVGGALLFLVLIRIPLWGHGPVAPVPAQSDVTIPDPSPVQAQAQVQQETPRAIKPPAYVVALMYHEIGDGPNSLYVSRANFEAHMKYLYEHDYRGITLAEGKAILDGRMENTGGIPLILTFDDGYMSFYTDAYPVMSRYGYKATVFMITKRVGSPNYCNWDQLHELVQAGFEVGSHTQTHPSLPTLTGSRLEDEIKGSKQILEAALGVPVVSFCYPAGEYNQATTEAVSRAGYQQGVTVKYGWATRANDPYQMPRIRISRYLTLDGFAKMIPGAAPSTPTAASASPATTGSAATAAGGGKTAAN